MMLVDDFGADAGDRVGDVLRRHQLGALLVDDLALVVRDVVVLEQVLAQVEVVGLDLALRALDLASTSILLSIDLAFLHAGRLQPALGALGIAEDAHQVVFERQIEAARARVALAARTAAQLVVDAARLVAFGADDVQAAGRDAPRRGASAILLDRGARRGLVGRVDLLAARPSRLPPSTMSVPRPAMLVAIVTAPGRPACATMCASRSCCFAFSTLCGMPCCLQQARQQLGRLDRCGADQRRLAALHALADVLDDRLVLVLLRQVDEVGRVVADHRPVRRDHDDLEAVDLLELEGFGVGRAGHAGQLRVHAEVVLERDRGDRLVLLAHAHAFLGFDGLVQAVRPAPARHRAAGEFVDDDDFAVADDVLDVACDTARARAAPRSGDASSRMLAGSYRLWPSCSSPASANSSSTCSWPVGQVHLLRLLVGPVVALAFLAPCALQPRHELVDAAGRARCFPRPDRK